MIKNKTDLALAAFLLVFAWAGWSDWRSSAARAPQTYLASMVTETGERLIHGLSIPERLNAVPLTALWRALAYNHSPAWLSAAALQLEWLSAPALTFALGSALGSPLGGGLAAFYCLWRLPLADEASGETTLFRLLFLLLACLLTRRAKAASAAVLGISLLCRSTLAFFPLGLAALERRRWKAAWLWLTPYLFLLPWAFMTWRRGHMMFLEGARPDSNVVSAALGLTATLEGDYRGLAGLAPGQSALAWAVGHILRHPLIYLHGWLSRLAFIVALKPLLVLGASAALWKTRRRPEFRPVAGLIVYFAGLYSLMTVESRYFQPLWPVLAAFAAAAFVRPKTPPARGVPGAGIIWIYGAAASFLALSACAVLLFSSPAAAPDLAAYPDDPWAWYFKGSVSNLREAQRLKPGEPFIEIAYAKALLAEGGADAALDEALKNLPACEEADLLRVQRALDRGSPDAAAIYARTRSSWRAVNVNIRQPLDGEASRRAYRDLALLEARDNPLGRKLRVLLSDWPEGRRRKAATFLDKIERSYDPAQAQPPAPRPGPPRLGPGTLERVYAFLQSLNPRGYSLNAL